LPVFDEILNQPIAANAVSAQQPNPIPKTAAASTSLKKCMPRTMREIAILHAKKYTATPRAIKVTDHQRDRKRRHGVTGWKRNLSGGRTFDQQAFQLARPLPMTQFFQQLEHADAHGRSQCRRRLLLANRCGPP